MVEVAGVFVTCRTKSLERGNEVADGEVLMKGFGGPVGGGGSGEKRVKAVALVAFWDGDAGPV